MKDIYKNIRQPVKRGSQYLITMTVLALILITPIFVSADDGPIFRKNVSNTPDLETEHAAIRMLPLYVPAQASDGTLLSPSADRLLYRRARRNH